MSSPYRVIYSPIQEVGAIYYVTRGFGWARGPTDKYSGIGTGQIKVL